MDFVRAISLIWPIIICLPLVSVFISKSSRAWQITNALAGITLLFSLIGWVCVVIVDIEFVSDWFVLNSLRATLLLLVSFIAYIVIGFSKTSFTSDTNGSHFLRWLMTTIFAVSITIASNHLFIFWISWVAISLSLHNLLVFYPSRYRAVLAAHKKFIFARMAEICLGLAFLLLYLQHQTFLISEILEQYPTTVITWQQHIIAALLAVVALIKCAQLPLHGWLIQVVESPTPVSALLHAGVINLGGFLILLFAPIFSQSPYAQWLLLLISGFTAALAALIMTTRISVKVRLAWSTTAQMGLMLVECALGLYELALLHLVAHSCYKAHAFLQAGSAVSDHIKNQYSGKLNITIETWIISAAIAIALIIIVVTSLGLSLPASPWLLVIIALAVTLAVRRELSPTRHVLAGIGDAALLIVLYIAFKYGASLIYPPITHTYMWQADVMMCALFLNVFLIYLFFQYQPHNRFSQKLFITLNASFYLDEWSTRLTLAIWPIHLPKK